jgi:type IV fimbrial biogenesis protein FimT
MKAKSSGLTFIELLIVVAMIGILAAVGFTQLDFGAVASRQAAQVVSASVNSARLEAIRSNAMVGIEVVAASAGFPSGYVRVCRNVLDTNPPACPALATSGDLANDPSTVRFVDFAEGDLARARINDSVTVFFDRRGVRNLAAAGDIRVSDRSGGNVRTLSVEITGRVVIQ